MWRRPAQGIRFGWARPQTTWAWSHPLRLCEGTPKNVGKTVPKTERSTTGTPLRENAKKESSGGGGGSKGGQGKGPGGGPEIPPLVIGPVHMAGIALLAVTSKIVYDSMGESPELTYQQFKNEYLETGQVDHVVIVNMMKVNVYLRHPKVGGHTEAVKPDFFFTIGSATWFEDRLNEIQDGFQIVPEDRIPVAYYDEPSFLGDIAPFIPVGLLIGFLYFASRRMRQGGGLFSMGKAKARLNKETGVKTTFADVAGCDEAKEEIMEFVEFLKAPDRFLELGAKIPKGALLTGPPGTGKTLLAKATAGEANVPFLSMSGSEFQEMFVGVGPSRVRDLFKQARECAPCIVFIDEIDAIGKKRQDRPGGGSDEQDSTLNQLLVEMDGFSTEGTIVVFAATNRKDILDAALLRPGRFDRQIEVDVANIGGRMEIFKVHLKPITLGDGENVIEEYAKKLAAFTPGFSGADIMNVCNEAALIAARHMKTVVDMEDFNAAIERIIGGIEKKHKVMNANQRKTVAYHESGHAVTGWFLEHASPLLKVSIVPRGGAALGYAMSLPSDQNLHTTEQLLHRMCVTLGGRAAERIFFDRVTTGAQNDLEKVTQLAYRQVVSYGMNEKVGPLSFPMPSPGDTVTDRPYSNATALAIDLEVREMIAKAYEQTLTLLREHREDVEKVAQRLLEKENIDRDDLIELLGPRPFSDKTTYEELMHGLREKKTAGDDADVDADVDADADANADVDGDVVGADGVDVDAADTNGETVDTAGAGTDSSVDGAGESAQGPKKE